MLIDGEHYPPVVAAAVEGLGGAYSVTGGIFAGGREKLRGGGAAAPGLAPDQASDRNGSAAGLAALAADVGLPWLHAVEPRAASAHETLEGARAALRAARAEVLVDLSDEPVVGYRERFLLMSAALAEGAALRGRRHRGAAAGLRAPRGHAVAGRHRHGQARRQDGGERLAGAAARRRPAGGRRRRRRGHGPRRPAGTGARSGGGDGLGPAELLAASRAGRHAASDCYEDAVLAGVTAIGCRRCGGGLAGAPFDDNVREALPLVEESGAALAVIEGSGAVVPPVLADATICVAGAGQPPDYVAGYLGTYRLLLSDALVLTQCEPPFAEPGDVAALTAAAKAVKPGIEVVPTVFRPRPAKPVRGRSVAFFTTAPEGAAPQLAAALAEDHGADVVLVSCDLADRAVSRRRSTRAAAEADVFLTEIKAAAVDVVAEAAAAAGRELVFCDNEPVALDGDLGATVDRLSALAVERFAARRDVASGDRPASGDGPTAGHGPATSG